MFARIKPLQATLKTTGHITDDVPAFLIQHGFPKTAQHSQDVAQKAKELAQQFSANPTHAEIAGILHDVSAIFPSKERATIAREFDVVVLPEEDIFPMIIHQKLSVVIARDLFGVSNQSILSAIGCHTTLKANASLLDKVVFVADKIAWDQAGTPPYLDDLLIGLEQSIEHAAFVYLNYLYTMRDNLKVWHSWCDQAHTQLKNQLF